jgi:glycosyltransferase involved in cell wall biosynthesis
MKACFFSRVKDERLLTIMQWYKNDISILRDLGHEVTVATKFGEIPWDCDLYCTWWYTTSIFPLIKAKLRRKPLVILGGGSEVITLSKDIRGYYSKTLPVQIIIRLCLKLADYVLAISKDQLKEMELLGATRAKVVYLGIDTDEYAGSDTPKGSGKLILSISHLNKENVERKRIWTVLKAIPYVLAEFPDAKFVIIGRHMDAYPDLKKFVVASGMDNSVKFPGLVSQEEKLDYLHRAAIYVQPTKHEAFGVGIAEAMSCRLPVISSRVGAVAEVLGDCGLYADPDDPKDLADKIILLLRDENLRRELGKKARERVLANFTYQKRKDEIQKVLDEVLGRYR